MNNENVKQSLLTAASWMFLVLFGVPLGSFLLWIFLAVPKGPGFLRQPAYQEVHYYVFAAWLLLYFTAAWINYSNPRTKDKFPRGKKDLLLFFLGMVMFSYLTAYVSIPLLSYWTPLHSSKLVTRAEEVVYHTSRRNRCRPHALVVESDTQLWSELCISAAAAKKIHKGDRITLTGKANAIAFYVEEIEL